MKTLFSFAWILSFTFFLISCGGDAQQATEAEAPAVAEPTAVSYQIDPAQSVITWVGKKSFVESKHNGTIKLADGSLEVLDGNVTAGKFTIDMNSIDNEDLKGTDGYEKLLGHLKSADFFAVDSFPQASFEVTGVSALEGDSVNTHTISGNLTIKGISKNITFPAKVSIDSNNFTAQGNVIINRADWEVKFGSNSFFPDLVGDKVISNDIELGLNLTGAAQTAAAM